MNAIAELRNIHFSAVATPGAMSRAEIAHRRINRSPDEEFGRRMDKGGPLGKFAQSVIGLIMQKQKFVQVGKNGITFEYMRNRYTFWHENSVACRDQVGQRVLVTFDPDNIEFCHVLTDDGRYIESLPAKNKVAWFDDEAMREEMRKKAHALNADLQRFRTIHKPTTEQKAAALKTNAEKMQIVNTFAAPAAETGQAETGRFAKADRIAEAAGSLTAQRARVDARETRTRARMRNLKADAEDVLFDRTRGRIEEEEDAAYAEMEEKIEALDKVY